MVPEGGSDGVFQRFVHSKGARVCAVARGCPGAGEAESVAGTIGSDGDGRPGDDAGAAEANRSTGGPGPATRGGAASGRARVSEARRTAAASSRNPCSWAIAAGGPGTRD